MGILPPIYFFINNIKNTCISTNILFGVGIKFWQEEKLKKFVKDTACEEIAERCVMYNPKKR